jgi:regulatory protein
MARKPRILSTEAELYAAAIGALARRSHSVHEMRQYLERRSDDRALAGSVLSRLRAEGLVDDARYARQFALNRSSNRRQGRFRIARELRARGVANIHIAAALEEVASQADESSMIRRRIEIWLRRHSFADASTLDRAKTGSLYQNLLRAGFPGDRIRAELRRYGNHASISVPDEDGGDE